MLVAARCAEDAAEAGLRRRRGSSGTRLEHYAQHGVSELVSVDPEQGAVQLYRLVESDYGAVERLNVVDLTAAQALACL